MISSNSHGHKSVMKKIQLYKLLPLLLLTHFSTCFISSCQHKEREIFSREKFARIYAEILIIENLAIPEKQKIVLINDFFERHHINPQTFQNTKQFYRNNPDFWLAVYKQSAEIIKARRDTLSRNLAPPGSDKAEE